MPRFRIKEWLVLDVHDSHSIRFYRACGILLLSPQWDGQRVSHLAWILSCLVLTNSVHFLLSSTIRLPGDVTRTSYNHDTGVIATLASVPWFIIGVAGIAYEWVASRVDTYLLDSRRGYRNLPIDEDAQILRFEDEE